MNPRIHAQAVHGLQHIALLLAGCTNLTGLDGSSQYACKAPEGVQCESVSGNYHNALRDNLPAQRKPTRAANRPGVSQPQSAPALPVPARSDAAAISTAIGTVAQMDGPAVVATPLRTGPRVLRLWIKPWEDADRDLNGESVVYVQIDNGRWLVDHVQRQAREPYAAIRPTRLPSSAAKGQAPDTRDPDPRSGPPQGLPTADDGSAVARALRALQARPEANPAN